MAERASFLAGLDIGGGGGRCLLVDPASGEIHSAFRPWSFPVARETGGLGFDADPEQMLASLGEAVVEALGRAKAKPGQIAGLAAASMRFGMVVIDSDGAVLYAGPNRDARAAAEAIALGASHGEELARRTGLWPMPTLAAPRLRWLAANRPDDWKRAQALLALNDWLAFRLCGELATDFSQAGCTMLFDLAERDWAWDWIDRLELPRSLFPSVHPAGTPLGTLTADAAGALGLLAGTPVMVGGADTQCGLLGCGARSEGDTAVIAGTTAPVQTVLAAPDLDPETRLWAGHHVLPGLWTLESNAGPVGETLEWFARLLHPDAPMPAAALLGEAARSEPGAAGMVSTLGAQLHDARALALPVGDLTLSHLPSARDPLTRRHLSRSVIEGMAYSLRANVEQLAAVVPLEQTRIRLGGGLSRSASFARLLADVLGRPVDVSRTPETTALGAAICAGVGAGVLEDLGEGAEQLAGIARSHEPDGEAARTYAGLYESWQRLRDARAGSEEEARGLALQAMLRSRGEAAAGGEVLRRPRILVTAAMDQESLAALEELGPVEYASFRERMRLLSGAALIDALREVEVFITEVDLVDTESVRQLPDLRVVASCRGDAVNVDVPGMTGLGIPVLNAPGRNAGAVADLTLAYLLMLARKLPRAAEFLRQPGIEPGDMGKMGQAFGALQGRELWRKSVGLIGLGAVGRAVARRLRPFGAGVLAFDPFVDPEQAMLDGAELVSLDELLARSNFVSLHAPVTDQTRNLIGAAELARMPSGAFLLNTARAALVDEDALFDALKSGHLAGAAIDVFSVEPPGSEHPLLGLPNLIATPHVGGNTVEVASHQGHIIATDLARLVHGERPRHALNPETLESFDWSAPRPAPDEERLAALASARGPTVSDLQRREARPAATTEETWVPQERRRTDVPREFVARMERVMAVFVGKIAGDEKLGRQAADQDVTLHFKLTDLPGECWVRLREGRVSAQSGAPDEPAEVQLKMRAYVFDGMFTGRVNAMEKAMSGELSFMGDTGKAMTLQGLQRDLNRLYRTAREEAGDPGDLESLPEPGAGGAAAAARHVAPGDVREELIATVNELYTTQLITATGGNVSARIPDEDAIWITPSQMFKGDLRPEILVRIDLEDGRPLDEGALSPSSERLMHCAAYRARPDAKAVIHAHAPNATILVNAGLPFLPISTEAAFFDDIPRIPFTMPGTQELADAIQEALRSSWAVLMQNHGILVAGRSLRRAADMAEIIERSTEVILGCYAVGKEPPVLPPDLVKTLREMGDLVA